MAIKVTVYSDYICPFCFVAFRRLERLEREEGIEVVWRGVEIHPETPPEGKVMPPSLAQKLAHPQGSVQHFAREEGLDLQIPPVVANSRLALEATEFAREQGKLAPFQRAVFEGYWQQGRNISLLPVIEEITREAVLDAGALGEYLREGRGQAQLRANAQEAFERGVAGVPSFLIGPDIFLEGVQAYGVFQRAIAKAKTKTNP